MKRFDNVAIDEWNRANWHARRVYRLEQGTLILPGSLAYRQGWLLAQPTREGFLEALADLEQATARVDLLEAMVRITELELGYAMLAIERLRGVEGQDEEAMRDLSQEDPHADLPRHGSVLGEVSTGASREASRRGE